jgi:flagellar P-ring protein precursor FlgI
MVYIAMRGTSKPVPKGYKMKHHCLSVLAQVCSALWLTVLLASNGAEAARIKDIANIGGVRANQLIGYGLVVGLDGSGDRGRGSGGKDFTIQSLVSMLERMGITVDPRDVKVKNVAAVMVTAQLLPFARTGNQLDVTVSSLGDAKSLQGGTLLLTPLRGVDGAVYAVAQGPISVGGFAAAGGGARVQKNHPTVGLIPGGATVERGIGTNLNGRDQITITLHRPDFTTAQRIAQIINSATAQGTASPVDSGTITVDIASTRHGNVVDLVARLESLEITPDTVAKVVLDERTGTVVMGENVRISTVAISHGSLSIQVREQPQVSQPLPFSEGRTTVVPDTQMAVEEEQRRLFVVEGGATIGQLVRALNALGVTPRDLIAIFQAIKAAGALHAALEII